MHVFLLLLSRNWVCHNFGHIEENRQIMCLLFRNQLIRSSNLQYENFLKSYTTCLSYIKELLKVVAVSLIKTKQWICQGHLYVYVSNVLSLNGKSF